MSQLTRPPCKANIRIQLAQSSNTVHPLKRSSNTIHPLARRYNTIHTLTHRYISSPFVPRQTLILARKIRHPFGGEGSQTPKTSKDSFDDSGRCTPTASQMGTPRTRRPGLPPDKEPSWQVSLVPEVVVPTPRAPLSQSSTHTRKAPRAPGDAAYHAEQDRIRADIDALQARLVRHRPAAGSFLILSMLSYAAGSARQDIPDHKDRACSGAA